MTGRTPSIPFAIGPPSKLLQGPGQIARTVRARARHREFWYVQAMVAAITAFHITIEAPHHGPPLDHLHHLAPALYVSPIIYASLRFGREGGLLTGLWCALLVVPNVVIWHQASLEWFIEAAQVGLAVTVGLVLSTRVEQEALERRRAEEMAARLSLVNRLATRAQEEERLRIARELHDETVQEMAFLSHALDEVVDTYALAEGAIDRLRQLRAMTDRTIAGVRRFSRDLRPRTLDDLGLIPALESHIRDLNEKANAGAALQPVQHRLRVSGTPRRLDSEAEVALFRIVQEALRNIAKHADASEALVDATFEEDRVCVEVRDDGSGFDGSASGADFLASGRLGLAGMRERAQLVGARLDVHSELGGGTAITVELNA